MNDLLATDECQFCGETLVASEDTEAMAMLIQHYVEDHADEVMRMQAVLEKMVPDAVCSACLGAGNVFGDNDGEIEARPCPECSE